ncbi:MAG: AI-2E family transporter [Chloroflexota bacterium]
MSEVGRRQDDRNQKQDGLTEDITEFRRRIVILMTIVLFFAIPILILFVAPSVLPLVFISILIAVLLNDLARPLKNQFGIAQRWSVLLVIATFIAATAIFVIFVGPQIASQFDQLVATIPESLRQLEESLRQYEWGAQLLAGIEQMPRDGGTADIFSQLTGVFSTAFGWLTNAVLILVAGIYMALEPDLYIKNGLRLVTPKYRERAADVVEEAHDILRRWLIARLISMIIVGILTFIGLTLVGMPLALSLSVIAGLLSFIPNIGPILSAIPAILVGLTQNLSLGLLAILVYTSVQQIENYLITPQVERQTMSLPPALVMLTQILLSLLFGWLGLLIAAPLVAVGIVLTKSLYVEEILGDRVGRIIEK